VRQSILVGVDLFCGAGGMSLGAERAGVKVLLAADSDPHAISTYRANHPGVRTVCKDIRRLRRIDVDSPKPLVVFGGPPCRGFSTSNQRTRSSENPENWLFREYLRIVSHLGPRWVVFENVEGLAHTEGGRFLKHVVSGLGRRGYTTATWVLNAVDFGVPQKRSRLFVIGSRHGGVPPEPSPQTLTSVTLAQAIGDLPPLPNGASTNWMPYAPRRPSRYAKLLRNGQRASANHLVTRNNSLVLQRYRHIPQGGNWESIPSRLMKNYCGRTQCHTGIYRRLELDCPSVVIGNYRKNMLVHPTEDRGLSVREAARLQSFPDDYEFHGSIGFQQQQVGNAVPPLLTEAVFRRIIERL